MNFMFLAADAGGGGGVSLDNLVQYGVLGIVCAILFAYAKQSNDREKARSEKAEKDRDDLQLYIREHFIPQQLASNQSIEKSNDILERVLVQLEVNRKDNRNG